MTNYIEQFANAFRVEQRPHHGSFFKLADGSADWMTKLVHEAHGDMLPEDTRYKMIYEVADALNDAYTHEDGEVSLDDIDVFEICDPLVSVYNNDRIQWLASRVDRASYVDDERAEGYFEGQDADIFTQLGVGMYREYEEIVTGKH